MSLSQNAIIDNINVTQYGGIEIRQRTDIVDSTNNQVVASSYQRWTLAPGDSLTNQDPKVVAIANATWTPTVISAYQTMLANAQKI